MNNKNIKKILHTSIIGVVLLSSCIYSQDCDDGFTYYSTFPENVNNINNDSNNDSNNNDKNIILSNYRD